MPPVVTVLGIGNDAMGDDAVGVSVVRGLIARAPAVPARLVDGGLGGMALVSHFLDSDVVIVIDAIDAGAEPGDIFRFDPDDAGISSLRSNSIHGMGLPHLLANARLMGAWPTVVVYAIQVGDVRPSLDGMTSAVSHSAEKVAAMVLAEVRSLTAEEAAG